MEIDLLQFTTDAANKYRMAADVCNQSMYALAEHIFNGGYTQHSIGELCAMGDEIIESRLSKVYNRPSCEKGVAFPTCISVNNVSSGYAPQSDSDERLNEGDLIKL